MAAGTRGRSGGPDTITAPPRNDAYTGLLIISLLAMITGTTLLVLDFLDYGDTKAPSVPVDAVKPAAGAVPPPEVKPDLTPLGEKPQPAPPPGGAAMEPK